MGTWKKNYISQNLGKILIEKNFLSFFPVFPEIDLEDMILQNFEKNPGKLHYQTLITLVVIQYVKYEML